MANTGVPIGLGFLITLLFMFALLPLSRSLGLIDRPGGRKLHTGDIPVTGGLAIFAGVAITMPFAYAGLQGFPFFLVSLFLLVFIGATDDRFDLPAVIRLLAQTCAALIMVFGADVIVRDIGEAFFAGTAGLGWFSSLFTVLIVLTAINAFNMFDGSDGVAGIQALIGLIFLGFVSIMSGSLRTLPVIGCLAGSVFAFLMFNWPSARTRDVRTFMGDAGSTMLGFSLAWLSVELSQGEGRAVSPAAVLWIFALPLYDFFSSMIRRVGEGRSPFHGDSEHLHHVLRRFGLSSRRVAQIMLIGGAMFAAIGVAGYLVGIPDGTLFLAWLVLGGLYHVIFGTRLVISRPVTDQSEEIASTSGLYASLWRQRGD
jgi:UDP-GlcNAc:undecaprenyl-phosphate GlcNAc-1-phosphate transferase